MTQFLVTLPLLKENELKKNNHILQDDNSFGLPQLDSESMSSGSLNLEDSFARINNLEE
jgi:hypothetical protein